MSTINYEYIETDSILVPGQKTSYFVATDVRTGVSVNIFDLWPPSRVVRTAKTLLSNPIKNTP